MGCHEQSLVEVFSTSLIKGALGGCGLGGACDHIKVLGRYIKENINFESICVQYALLCCGEHFLQTSSVKDGTCIHRPCCVPLPFQQSLLYSSLLYLLFLSSGYFNGARLFQDDRTDQRNAAGGVCMNMSVVCLTSFRFSLLFPEPVAPCYYYYCIHTFDIKFKLPIF